jgi:heterotetrameric sarcosine oxidase gamma subunit
VARSPIAVEGPGVVRDGWLVCARTAAASLRLADLTPLAKVHVRCDPDEPAAAALGVRRGAAVRRGTDLLVGSGPGEWLVLGPPGDAARLAEDVTARLAAAVHAGAHASVVDLTHGRALVRLTGADAAATLAKLTTVDLRDRSVPDGTALRTAVARLAVDIVRADVRSDGAPVRSYLLHCERSSGQYLADRVLDAGSEFGVEVDAFAWPGPAGDG